MTEHLISPLHNNLWHTGQFGHMDTETVFASTSSEFAQKHDFTLYLTDRHVIVDHTAETLFHLVELMIVSGEESLGMGGAMLVDILDYSPCDRDTVIGRCAAAKLVKKYEGAFAHVIEDGCGLVHLDHKSRLSERNIVRSSDSRKNLVDHAYVRTLGRHKRTNLRKQHIESCLTEQSRLARHIRACYHHHLCAGIGQIDTIGDIRLARRQFFFYDGMTPLHDRKLERIIYHRTVVTVLDSYACKRIEHIKLRHQLPIKKYCRDIVGKASDEFGIYALLDDGNLILCAKYLLLILLEFLGDVTLGIDKSLLAYPLWRHLVAVGIGDLDIISEYVVICHFERRNTRALALALLQLSKIILATIGDITQLVKLFIHSWTNYFATIDGRRGIFHYLTGYLLGDSGTGIELIADRLKYRKIGSTTHALDVGNHTESIAQL